MTMSTLFTFLGIGVIFYLMRRSGGGCCGGHSHGDKKDPGAHENSTNGVDSDHRHHREKLEYSKNESGKDPVCNMDVGNHSIASKHSGHTFYFCSNQCRTIFNLNPNKYVGT